jgi:hypothetical protein
VSIPLRKGYPQSAPSLDVINQTLTTIEGLVDVGKIATVDDLEVALKWSARVRQPFTSIDKLELT